MNSSDLDRFIGFALLNPPFRDLIAAGQYQAAFMEAGLPPPTDEQIAAIEAQDWASLQLLAESFGEDITAN